MSSLVCIRSRFDSRVILFIKPSESVVKLTVLSLIISMVHLTCSAQLRNGNVRRALICRTQDSSERTHRSCGANNLLREIVTFRTRHFMPIFAPLSSHTDGSNLGEPTETPPRHQMESRQGQSCIHPP